jgi:hypothetical protein
MRKIVAALVALLLTSSAWAGVQISCSASGNDVTISYDASSENELVRAFALDVTVDNGQTIDAVVSTNPDYDIYPGSIVIDAGGNVTDWGSPIASQSDYPGDTLGGLSTGGVTIEMGSLYAQGETPPAAADDLITLTVSGNCSVTITENVIRGGVVMEDPSVPANPSFSSCAVGGTGCYTGPDMAEWQAVGEPASWCEPRQCHGDADGQQEAYLRGQVWVGMNDVAILVTGFRAAYGGDPQVHPWIAADFDHSDEPYLRGTVRVGMNDVAELVTYFRAATVPADCLD